MRSPARARWIGYAGALGAVVLVSGIIAFIAGRIHVANISMFYLIAVLATASAFGSGPAVTSAVAAWLALRLFIQPVLSFEVADPEESVVVLLFLITAVVTGQLAASQRRRASEARQHEREAIVLYDVVRLMSENDLDEALPAVAERLGQELPLTAVLIEVADGPLVAGRAVWGDPEALRMTDAAGPSTTASGERRAPANTDGTAGDWVGMPRPEPKASGRRLDGDRLDVVPVTAQNQRIGELVLVSTPGGPAFTVADDRLLSAVAAQLGLLTERMRLRREATEAEILRRTDELRTALLHAVSHDLQTPLASIIASAGSLLQDDVTWTEQDRRDFAESTKEEAQRLSRIVMNLLDLSRIEAGSLCPQKTWYDFQALVDEVLGRLRPLSAQHRVVVDVPDDLPPVNLDYVEIDQVLSNLIANATKYAPAGTEIVVSAKAQDGELFVAVEDRGPGIPSSALPHLFEPFYRAQGQSPRPDSAGLGLAIAKGLVQAHSGRIWAQNRPGGGARFAFTLPLAVPPEVVMASGEPNA